MDVRTGFLHATDEGTGSFRQSASNNGVPLKLVLPVVVIFATYYQSALACFIIKLFDIE